MADSAVRIAPGDAIDPHLQSGAKIRLAAGVHHASLWISASVDIEGEEGAVINADRAGPVINVVGDSLVVRVAGVRLTGGAGEAGGAVRVAGRSEVTLSGCVAEDNEATLGGSGVGGGIWAGRGKVVLKDTRFAGNRARSGSDLFLANVAQLECEGGDFGGDVVVTEGARASFVGTRVRGKLIARGTTTRAPAIVLRGAAIDGGVENDPNLPAAIVVEDG